MLVKSVGPGEKLPGFIQALLLISCVIMGKILNLCALVSSAVKWR